MFEAATMISTENLQPRRTIADQLDDLVLESFGAVDLVFAETGLSSSAALAAAAWCHAFGRRTPSTALVDLTDLASGSFQVRCGRQEYLYELQVSNAGVYTSLFDRLANADVVVLDGVNNAAQTAMPALLKFLAGCAWRSPLTLAPITLAGPFIRHPLLCHLQIVSDELISTDAVSDQRAALIAATFMRQSQAGQEGSNS
jgi:hypothetical protein